MFFIVHVFLCVVPSITNMFSNAEVKLVQNE